MFTLHMFGSDVLVNLRDPWVWTPLAALWLAAFLWLVSYLVTDRHREEPTEEEVEEQRPETDVIDGEEIDEDETISPEPSWFGRLRLRLFGAEPEGATADLTTFTNVPRRGRISGDMDSVTDRAEWHDRLRDVAVRFEEKLDTSLLEIAERFGCYDEMLQALGATHVHVPDSFEIDEAAAPLANMMERCMDADTEMWTVDDQRALEKLLEEESTRSK